MQVILLQRVAKLGQMGDVVRVNTRFLDSLFTHDIMPVIAPIGVDPDGQVHNINADTAAGRFDHDAAAAVLAEAGHRVPRPRRSRPAGLSDREVEVLDPAAMTGQKRSAKK